MNDKSLLIERDLIGRLGATPSPKDDRDYKLSQLIASAPVLDKVHEPTYIAPILDQGKTNQCVACSLATTRHYIEHNQTGDSNIFSTNYIYGNRTDKQYNGEGMVAREALEQLQDYGTPHKSPDEVFMDFPTAKKYYQDHKTDLDRDARPFRISSYYKLNNVIEIKQAIALFGSITGMFPVYECLYDVGQDGVVKYNNLSNKYNYGYHEMTLIGWDDNNGIFYDQNSWGTNWGKNGIALLPYDYTIVEAWATPDDITIKQLTINN